MKYLLAAIIGLTLATAERPVVNVPKAARQSNWLGSQGEGSCVIASTISLLRWQGRYKMAERWRSQYSNGQGPESLAAKFEANGMRFAETISGDIRFLEWAVRTRRGCGVTVMGGSHMVTLVGLDKKFAYLLDNNAVESFIVVPRATFLAEWRASYGWAVTPVYCPAAPLPQ
jgi:hypothetical protein